MMDLLHIHNCSKTLAFKKFKNPTTALYSETTKPENFNLKRTIKNAKITKLLHAYKGSASTYTVEILNSFNPELQLKNTEFSVRNKLQ